MKEIIFQTIEWAALFIGLVGICIILIGAIMALYQYVTKTSSLFPRVRMTLGSHLILGLDFLVGKDLIDTLLLGELGNTGRFFYEDLLALITIVTIRIILSFVLEKEMEILKNKKS